MEQLTDVPLSFLTKLSESRDVMIAADQFAAEKAKNVGTGMRNEPLAPRNSNSTQTMGDSVAGAKQKYQPAPDINYLEELPPHIREQQMMQPQTQAPKPAIAGPITDALVDNSGMPDAVKKAMKQFPTSTDAPVVPLSEDAMKNVRTDLMDYAGTSAKPASKGRPLQSRQQLNEQVPAQAPKTVKMSENMIRDMVRDEMMTIMTKNIREQAIKDTITTLMKEGIIPKK